MSERAQALELLIAMARDWTDVAVVRDAPERVPNVIKQLIAALEAPPVGVSPQPDTHLQAFDIMQAWVNRGCTVPDCRPCFECLQALHKVIRDALESPASLSPVEAAGRSQ